MEITLTPFIALVAGGLVAALVALGYILTKMKVTGSPALAAALGAGFAAYTAVTIYSGGVMPLIANQTANMWGVQVWWDLLLSLGIALFLIAPRAHKQGMNLTLWMLFVVVTASIGLLAMCARLFWLETANGDANGDNITASTGALDESTSTTGLDKSEVASPT
jgi:hypothetical protein